MADEQGRWGSHDSDRFPSETDDVNERNLRSYACVTSSGSRPCSRVTSAGISSAGTGRAK